MTVRKYIEIRSNTSFGFFISKTVATIKDQIPKGDILIYIDINVHIINTLQKMLTYNITKRIILTLALFNTSNIFTNSSASFL